MHLIDRAHGNIGANAIVGAGMPIAVGAAMSFKLRGEPNVALTFMGDGATNIGTFHESLNMAAVWKAPVVFIITNNLYGEYSPVRMTTPIDDLARRAEPYDMPGVIVDGQDVDAVHTAYHGGGGPRPCRRRPQPARDEDLPLPGSLALRTRQVPARRRARELEGT